MKYVMIKTKVSGIDKLVPVIFPDFMVHQQVATAIEFILQGSHHMDTEIYSAGDIDLGRVECYGRSETLEVSSSDIDSQVINSYNYLHGLVY